MFKVLEYNKAVSTLNELENDIQEALDKNGDLEKFSIYESQATTTLFVSMTFLDTDLSTKDVVTFGPGSLKTIEEQIAATIVLARSQGKEVIFSDIRILNRSTRTVGFLILKKVRTPVNGKKKRESKETSPIANKRAE